MPSKKHSGKEPAISATIKTEVVCPNDTNPMDLLKGGRLVEWMDIAAAVCAQTHAGTIAVTASINRVDFFEAVKIGAIVTMYANITRSFTTSMEIQVKAYARTVAEGKNFLVSEAYFTFVALDSYGKKTKAMAVLPRGKEEKKQYEAALIRRAKIQVAE